MIKQLSIIAIFGLVSAQETTVTLVNNCAYTVWPGITPQANLYDDLYTGGLELISQGRQNIFLPEEYSGETWARTGCSGSASNFTCDTGTCDLMLNCMTSPTNGHVIHVDFTINRTGNSHSLKLGNPSGDFSIGMGITPIEYCPDVNHAACLDVEGHGTGCRALSSCPFGTSYAVTFCYEED